MRSWRLTRDIAMRLGCWPTWQSACWRDSCALASIRLEAADACSKKLIVEFAKPSCFLVEKKRKERISAAQCDARNRVQQRAWEYDCAPKRRPEFSGPVFRKA